MKSAHRSTSVTAGCAVLFVAALASAQDWPQWRGPNRDGKVSGFAAPEKWPEAPAAKWKVTVGTGDATPALVGDKLYVFAREGKEEVLRCLSAADGKEIWKEKYETVAVSGPAGRHPGPRSSPAVGEGKVVTLGVGGVVSCWVAATGKNLWRKDDFNGAVPGFFTAMSPVIADGKCIAHVGGKGKGAVIAYDLATGDQKWKWEGDGPAYASPVLMTVDGTKMVVEQGEKVLVGLGLADGKPLWQVPTPIARGARVYNSATPIIDGQTVYFTGSGSGTKAVKIEKDGDKFAVKDVWSNDGLGTGFNTPVLKDGLLFGCTEKATLFCIDAKTGKTAWSDPAKRKNFCAILDAGPVVVALPEDGQIIAYKPVDKGFEEVGKMKVAETETYAHPVISGKRIFVKDKDSVALFTLE